MDTEGKDQPASVNGCSGDILCALPGCFNRFKSRKKIKFCSKEYKKAYHRLAYRLGEAAIEALKE